MLLRFWSTAMAKTINREARLHAKVDGKKIIVIDSVLDLKKIKTTQQQEIASLKRRVKKLEKRNRLRTHKLKRLYKVGLSARVKSSGDEESLDTLVGEEVFVARQNENVVEEVVDAAQVSTAVTTVTINTKEITLAQALKALRTSKPKVKGIVFQEPGKSTTTTTISLQQSHEKGKRIMIEEPVKPKKKDQIRLDEEAAKRLQAEFDEEERLQKVEDDKEKAKLKQLMETILNEEEVADDAIPLAVKSPRIVDWKIHKEGKKSYYQIVRADGKSQMYTIFSQMLKIFDKEDLEDLYKLVKARYGSTRPVENMDYLLWSDIKTMFEPHVEDEIWKMKQGYKVLEWKLYDSCGVHFLMMQSIQIYMLVEKKYPLTLPTLSMMLDKKLQIDYESEMAYQLCKLIKKQLKN
nr:hypothetical protein [Tanacetum cinerariifolium]